MHVPFLDLQKQYQTIQETLEPELLALMRSAAFVLGPTVESLEANLAQFTNSQYAIGVSSGTDALICALMALDIGPGDEVLVPSFTFFATAGAVSRVGAKPVFVDICKDSYLIDVAHAETLITKNTKCIIPVHLYGQLAAMDQVLALANKHDLKVVEDACQSIGASHQGEVKGVQGDMACLSFYPTKNLGAAGDGGMILTNDARLANRCFDLRIHGHDRLGTPYYHLSVGGNFRIDAIQAKVLDVKLRQLGAWNNKRQSNASLYNELLCDAVKTPVLLSENTSVYHQYVVGVKDRDALKLYLQNANIGSAVFYPMGLHMQECFKSLGCKAGDCPVTEQACLEVLALPIVPEISDEQIAYVAKTINAFYQ